MVRLLRWGTLLVLLLVIFVTALAFPRLRTRLFVAAPVAPVITARSLADAAVSPAATSSARPTLAMLTPRATRASVVIAGPTSTQAPSATPTLFADEPASSHTAVATTSLLPAAITPIVLGPNLAGLATPNPLGVSGISSPSTPVAVAGTVGSNEAVASSAPVLSPTLPPTVTGAAPPANLTPRVVTPIVVVPMAAATLDAVTVDDPAAVTATPPITPVLALTVAVTPEPTATPLLLGPTANITGPLYAAPDISSPIQGEVAAGAPLTIIGLYTEGNWYLLANGLWIFGDAVDNAPLALPLVFPTMTPPPSATPTPTFTPLPTPTEIGSPTPTPTATSLDEPVCDCSADTLDCLGNIFANRGEAQRCFEYCFRQTSRDIHLLDPNLNGMACENLPDVLPFAPVAVPPSVPRAGCDPNYVGACVPITTIDLNCADIPAKDFLSVGSDPHDLDGDKNGIACQS